MLLLLLFSYNSTASMSPKVTIKEAVQCIESFTQKQPLILILASQGNILTLFDSFIDLIVLHLL